MECSDPYSEREASESCTYGDMILVKAYGTVLTKLQLIGPSRGDTLELSSTVPFPHLTVAGRAIDTRQICRCKQSACTR